MDPYVAIAGLIVGVVVGLTGMGGGALMTPILVLLFKVEPLTAVSSDLVAALVMKPVGAGVHMRRGTVNWSLVKWLMLGSVPSAFLGVLLLRALGNDAAIQTDLEYILGGALLIASLTMVVKWTLDRRRGGGAGKVDSIEVKPLRTLVIGAVGGLVVGMTSVGSGSLIIVTLLILYPALNARSLVGTDLVQAIPLVASAAIAHIIFGDFQLGLTASVLLGSIPGVYIGARFSSRAPDRVIREVLAFVLLASGLKLVGVGTTQLAWILSLVALTAWVARPTVVPTIRRSVAAARETWTRAMDGGVRRRGARAANAGASLLHAYLVFFRPKLVREFEVEEP